MTAAVARPLERRELPGRRPTSSNAGGSTRLVATPSRALTMPQSDPAEPRSKRIEREHLRVVPRRRPITSILAPLFALIFTAMLGITVFQTRMAQQQVQLDQLQVAVDKAQARHQELLKAQAELRSPQRIGISAHTLGLVTPSAVGFVTVDRSTYAEVVAGSGSLASGTSSDPSGP